ncbi:LCP family protein [Lawsonibacter sp. LCP25S3_G6]|uniref:LCP family protein n=1 Tax=unclassified Lawsonibacter TaxID=2617946 RepID=UPI003F9ABAC8
MTLEEKYLNVPRERREPAPRPRPEGRRAEERWDEPPRRRKKSARPSAARQKAKPRRSRAASIGLGCYKALVVVSALIVAAYIGLQLMSKAPEQKVPENNTPDNNTVVVGDGSGDTSQADPNALERREGVYNIFLAATDVEGFRTDTMMVLSYDTVEQKVGVVSIPRDTITQRETGKNPKLVYGSGGVERRIEEISDMLGIVIDGYVKVDINGFIALVDYLDGVDFYVPVDMNYDDPVQNLHIHYQKGMQHLNGQQAMEVARYRHDNNNPDGTPGPNQDYTDVGRTKTQQEILIALAKKVLAWDSLTKINGFVEIFNQYVETDLTLNNMLFFAQKAVDLDVNSGVETATLEGRGDAIYQGFLWCFELDEEKTVETVNRLINPYGRALTAEDMNLMPADSYYQY